MTMCVNMDIHFFCVHDIITIIPLYFCTLIFTFNQLNEQLNFQI